MGVTLAAERTAIHVVLSDVSEAALELARGNADVLGVGDRTECIESDLFGGLAACAYDVITANPPYIVDSEVAGLAPEIARHEPAIALCGGLDGLDIHRRIAAQAPRWLAHGAALLLEVGAGQAQAVAALCVSVPGLGDVTTHRDLGDIERVVEARRV